MKQITAVVLGFGDRSQIYSKYSLTHSNSLKIVGIVEPNKLRREYAKSIFKLCDSQCFSEYDEFIKCGKLADCVINGTMDKIHVTTTLPLLPLGYDILLEKPITSKREDLLTLSRAAKKYGNKILVCHVLRYTPFYSKIKQILLSGEIGEVRNIETSENVGVAHASISYIRGKWNNSEDCGSSYMMAKCCHDYDLLSWFYSGILPKKVSSFGTRKYFIAQKAPLGAGTKCLVDCCVEKECPYSAYKMHILNNPMPLYVWNCIGKLLQDITLEEKIQSLKTNNAHGNCIYKTNANIVDQQLSILEFENGSTASHSLISSVARAGRRIFIHGTKGEIEGFSEDTFVKVRIYNPQTILCDEKIVETDKYDKGDNHMGGDLRIMDDFCRVISGENPSISTTPLDDSIYSHLMVLAVDESMQKQQIVEIQPL